MTQPERQLVRRVALRRWCGRLVDLRCLRRVCFCVSSQHSSSIELSSHRQIDVDRRTRCTSGSSTTFLREFTSVNWLTKSVVRRLTMNFMIAGIDVAWIPLASLPIFTTVRGGSDRAKSLPS